MIYRDVGKKIVDGFNKGMRDNVSSVGKKFAKASVQIKDAPTEDVAPVVHAQWYEFSDYTGTHYAECSRCGLLWWIEEGTAEENEMFYCPKCGAKMDEKEGQR